ncbi:MAG: TetR/AcrR family transcriptional regulator [Clostridia bacterium]|nr:TetR/AcrR family transcriptional regulator [Clostridia bacterium]
MPKIIDNLSQKLKDEARKQVKEFGYSAVSIRSIAKACGIGTGTFYNYYKSKEALIFGFMYEDWSETLKEIDEAGKSGSIDIILKAVWDGLISFAGKYAELFSSVSEYIDAVPKKYHIYLRNQLADIIALHVFDKFKSEFIAEALLVWSGEGKNYDEVYSLIKKII